MEPSMIWFVVFTLVSLAVGVAFGNLCCQTMQSRYFCPLRFTAIVAFVAVLMMDGLMTMAMMEVIAEVIQPEAILAFSMVFLITTLSGLSLMLPEFLRLFSQHSK